MAMSADPTPFPSMSRGSNTFLTHNSVTGVQAVELEWSGASIGEPMYSVGVLFSVIDINNRISRQMEQIYIYCPQKIYSYDESNYIYIQCNKF